MNKKGQAGNGLQLAAYIVFGVIGLFIALIIGFIFASTLVNANLLTGGRTTTTVTNQSGYAINGTTYTLSNVGQGNFVPGTFTVTAAYNETNQGNASLPGFLIAATNYTVDSTAGTIVGAAGRTFNFSTVNISYTYQVQSNEEFTTNKLSGNFTNGTGNISSQIPTTFAIAAVIMIFVVLSALFYYYQRIRGTGSL